jgi:hypothetical protein
MHSGINAPNIKTRQLTILLALCSLMALAWVKMMAFLEFCEHKFLCASL